MIHEPMEIDEDGVYDTHTIAPSSREDAAGHSDGIPYGVTSESATIVRPNQVPAQTAASRAVSEICILCMRIFIATLPDEGMVSINWMFGIILNSMQVSCRHRDRREEPAAHEPE